VDLIAHLPQVAAPSRPRPARRASRPTTEGSTPAC